MLEASRPTHFEQRFREKIDRGILINKVFGCFSDRSVEAETMTSTKPNLGLLQSKEGICG